MDGSFHVWNVTDWIDKGQTTTSCCIISHHQHAPGPVAAVAFSSEQGLATGGCDGKIIFVMDLMGTTTDDDNNNNNTSSQPNNNNIVELQSQSAEITALAWNTQVGHICASASGDGSVAVWDVSARKMWCKLQVEHGGPVSDVVWNPSLGLYLITASGDDRNPNLKIWDLGASTSVPLSTLQGGHSAGILKCSWCPHDETLLLTCGKDNRTLLWDLVRLQAVAEVPFSSRAPTPTTTTTTTNPNQLFASSSSWNKEQKHMRVYVQWSPHQRGMALTCSFDRTVQIHSLLSVAQQCTGRPPQWMMTPTSSCVSTSFGALIVQVGKSTHPAVVTLRTVPERDDLVAWSTELETKLATMSMLEFCEQQQQQQHQHDDDQIMWGFMRVIFENNPREKLLEHLGYHGTEIAPSAAAALSRHENDPLNGVANLSLKDDDDASKTHHGMTPEAQELVKRSLIVGNFSAAVDCCLEAENYADALLLSYCGGGDLWTKTQQRYFDKESSRRPYLTLLGNVVNGRLEELVSHSDVTQWPETLAILSSYAQSDEFPLLTIALGERLESSGDPENACLCFMCALAVEHAVRYWKFQYNTESKGGTDLLALHNFVVKVSVFMRAVGSQAQIPDDVAELFSQYAKALAEQGLLATAARYCKGVSEESKILRDRLYRSRDSQRCLAELGSAPEFPFALVTVNKSQQRSAQPNTARATAASTARQQTQAAYTQQSYPTVSSAAAQVTDQLPAGWIALVDPASGNYYYANQMTGESTWERPQFVPEASVQSFQPPAGSGGAGLDSSIHSNASSISNNPSKRSTKAALVSKYGDGFVTSASHPELADQYGNVGTSNPYTGVARPGTAAAVVKLAVEDAPPSGPSDINAIELSPDQIYIRDVLVSLQEHLQIVCSPSERRLLDEAGKGTEALVRKLSRGAIEEDIVSQLQAMVNAIASHDFRSSTAIQTTLVNNEWKYHKDWLKGLQLLLQLASKRM